MTVWVPGFWRHVTTRMRPKERGADLRQARLDSAARRSLAHALVWSAVVHVWVAYVGSHAVADVSPEVRTRESDSIGIDLHRIEAHVDSGAWDTVSEAAKTQRSKTGSRLRDSVNKQPGGEADGLSEAGGQKRRSEQGIKGDASQQHLDRQPVPTDGDGSGREGSVAIHASTNPAASPDQSSARTPAASDGEGTSAQSSHGAGPKMTGAQAGASQRGAPGNGARPIRVRGGSASAGVYSLHVGSAASERIREAIQRGVVYPRLGRRLGWQGKVVVGFDVAPHGEVRGARVVRSSGYAALDSSALAAVARAAPLPDVGTWLRLEIPIVFVLR